MPLAHRRAGSGPPLVLVHGIGSQHEMWEPVFERLARERDVIAVDLPGFGDSPALGEPPTVEALARAVIGLLDELGVAGAHVAGNSLGGAVALEVGGQGRARSVCVLSPAGFGNMREGDYARLVLVAARRGARLAAPAAERLNAGPVGRTLLNSSMVARPWRIPPAEAAGALRNLGRSPGFETTLAALADHRFGGEAPSCPVTVAWGERDRLLLFSRQSARARRLLPGATHVTLWGCGHVPTWDDPDQVARVLLEASGATRSQPPREPAAV